MLVTPAAGKLWRLVYRFDGKQKQLALGAYPGVGSETAIAGPAIIIIHTRSGKLVPEVANVACLQTGSGGRSSCG
ncbi:Arm DNA-binding domain-containing protein [Xanthobacter nonsaccharivorans]|uniref:Arm DNA-binding domain-containing protein n=1 Tax=Xanthobacter nonsaccharivorans TaxID=3119912 RepID=UPI00372D05B6